jgi:hypothetical protein
MQYFGDMKEKRTGRRGYSVERYIHGVLGGKVNTHGGHSISPSKQNVYIYMCPIPNGFQDRATLLCSTPYTVQTSNMPCSYTSCKVHWRWLRYFRTCIILGKLYQLCHLNNKYWYMKYYIIYLSFQPFLELYIEIVLSWKPFGIGHVYIHFLA